MQMTENLDSQKINAGLDAIQLALDTWGLEPFTGWIGDLTNAGISSGRAIHAGVTGGNWKGHTLDAAISLVSTLPFGDIAKLLKARHGAKYAKMFIQAARWAKTGAKTQKATTNVRRTSNIAATFGDQFGRRQQPVGGGKIQPTGTLGVPVAS